MAKKIWAYAKLENKYISDINKERKRLFFIWEALKLKQISDDLHYERSLSSPPEFNYKDLTFISTQNDESSRVELVPVINGYFRYPPGRTPDASSGDGESLSHELAILAISQLDKIPFVIGEDKLVIEFVDFLIDGEMTKLQFGDGKYYYPDLIGYIKKGTTNYEKWGGKVSIEVKVTHGYKPEDPRIQLFQRHNFAVLQITVSDKFKFPPELPNSNAKITAESLEQHVEFLKSRFSEKTFATIISDPMVTSFSKKLISEKQQELDLTYRKLKKLNSSETDFKNKLMSKKEQVGLLFEQIIELNNNINSLSDNHREEIDILKKEKNVLTRFKQVSLGLTFFIVSMALVKIIFPSWSIKLLKQYFTLIFSLHN
jgi:hypothetical protein